MEMKSKLGWRRVTLSASCAVIVCGIAAALWAQAPAFSITLTGQSMIRSDTRTIGSGRLAQEMDT